MAISAICQPLWRNLERLLSAAMRAMLWGIRCMRRLFVRGSVKSLGADCIEKEMRPEHIMMLQGLLAEAGSNAKPEEFTRYGSARKLYHFDVDNAGNY